LAVPDPTRFARVVQEYEEKNEALDRFYLTSLHEFKKIKPDYFGGYEAYSVLCLYLLKWGNMKRVLGYQGCKRLSEKLGDMKNNFDEFQLLSLNTVNLQRLSTTVEDVYDELLNAEWTSEKGRTKRIGPTAAAKTLHLVAPDVFMIWDRKIRQTYGFRDNGREYLRFMLEMQNWLMKLNSTINGLGAKYEKPKTKIIDEYNWKTSWG
jgi:hypothetical protein